MKKSSIAILIAIMIMIPAMILANGNQRPIQRQMRRQIVRQAPQLQDRLQLTEQQRERMHGLRVQYQKNRIPLRSDLQLAEIELEELIRTEAGDRSIASQIDKINKLRGDLYGLRVRERVARSKMLTPQQRQTLREFGPGRRMRRDLRHRHPMRPGMQGPRYMFDEPLAPMDEEIDIMHE